MSPDRDDGAPALAGEWILEGHLGPGATPSRLPLPQLPARVGRLEGADLVLPFRDVSGQHAELYSEGARLFVRDLGSTNGTFVNREPVDAPQEIEPGDVLHFGEHEFRLLYERKESSSGATMAVDLRRTNLPSRLVTGTRELAELLRDRAVEPSFQPVVDLRAGSIVGYEILGRGSHPKLPRSPLELFRVAAAAGSVVELSRLFRDRGVQVAQSLAGRPELYFNTHPDELLDLGQLMESLQQLREAFPQSRLLLEIHEGAVLGADEMRRLRDQLAGLRIGLAYDDFGAGRARLAELLEVPPDVLKFDISIVRELHTASSAKRSMVESLVAMLASHQIRCLAEGIETAAEAAACHELGFDLAQGYHFGRPQPIDQLRSLAIVSDAPPR